MPKVSRDTAPEVVDYGPAEDRTGHFDGYTINFTSVREDSDLAPLLKGLPGDSCQCPHWGYMLAGRIPPATPTTTSSSSPAMRSTCRPGTCRWQRPGPSSSCSAPAANWRYRRPR